MPGKRSNGEGTLRKRSNGLWECTMMVGYKDDGTRRYKSFYGKSQKEAKDKADAYKQEVAAGLYIDPNLTFQAWAKKWYEGYKDSVSPTTYESYGYTLKTLVKGFGPRKLASIKALDVENFLKGLRADGKSDSYLTKCRGMLYQIMHKAEANDLIRKNPVRFAEKMKAQRPVKRKEAFTQEEVQRLMEDLPQDKTGHTIRLMLATGMRTQEVLALEPQHIEPDGSCIHIRQAVNMVKGRPYIGPPKTANSVRDVPVPPNVQPCAVFLREQAGKFVCPCFSVSRVRRFFLLQKLGILSVQFFDTGELFQAELFKSLLRRLVESDCLTMPLKEFFAIPRLAIGHIDLPCFGVVDDVFFKAAISCSRCSAALMESPRPLN